MDGRVWARAWGHGDMSPWWQTPWSSKDQCCSQPSQKKLRAKWQARQIHHQIQNWVYHYQHGVTSESPSLSSVASVLSSCLILLHLSDEDLVRSDQSRAIGSHPNCRLNFGKSFVSKRGQVVGIWLVMKILSRILSDEKRHLGSLRSRCVGVMTRKTQTRDILWIPAYVNNFFSPIGMIIFSVIWGPFRRYSFVRLTQYHNTCHPTYFYQWVKIQQADISQRSGSWVWNAQSDTHSFTSLSPPPRRL
jgi:hypothetical protein